MGPPNIHNMLGLSRAMHVHVLGIHVHSITHIGNVMSWGHLCWLLAYTRVQHLVCLLKWSMWAIWCNVLLCRAMAKVFYVWVGANEDQVWPRFNFVVWAKCAFGLGIVSG